MKVCDLIGPALDWAVAKCEGVSEEAFRRYYEPTEPTDYDRHGFPEFHYSTVWHKGGPIIERESVELSSPRLVAREKWRALHIGGAAACEAHGPTPLIAAMRCYVASKLGDDVHIPAELL